MHPDDNRSRLIIVPDLYVDLNHIVAEPTDALLLTAQCGASSTLTAPRSVSRVLCPICVLRAAQWLTTPPKAER